MNRNGITLKGQTTLETYLDPSKPTEMRVKDGLAET